jgi:hypothetical protein
MGRTLIEKEEYRFIVTLKKITYPGGERLTRSLTPYDIEGRTYSPNSEIINKTLPFIDKRYGLLVEECNKRSISEALNQFLEEVSQYAIVGSGLIGVLSTDLNQNIDTILNALLKTKWFKSILNYIKSEFRKANKKDPIKYAESVRQFVDIFGPKYAMYLMNNEGIKIKRSTITALCRIASETPKIKALIREGKLKLTLAFELPNIKEKDREEIAEQISGVTYEEAKNILKKMKGK